MKLTEALELLENGHKIRHVSWDDDKYVEMSMYLIDENMDASYINITNPHDFDDWELYLPDGWHQQDGRDYLKYGEWNIWDYRNCTWVRCSPPDKPYLKQEGNYHPENYNIVSRLEDNIPF